MESGTIRVKIGGEWRDIESLTRVVHNTCHKTAFYYDGPLEGGTIVESGKAVFPDGTHPVQGSPMLCGSCGRPIDATNGRVTGASVAE